MVLVKAVATSPDKGPNDIVNEVTELLTAKSQELKTLAQVRVCVCAPPAAGAAVAVAWPTAAAPQSAHRRAGRLHGWSLLARLA